MTKSNRNIRVAQRRRYAAAALRALLSEDAPRSKKRISAIEVLRPLARDIIAARKAGWPIAKIASTLAPHLQAKEGSTKAAIRTILAEGVES